MFIYFKKILIKYSYSYINKIFKQLYWFIFCKKILIKYLNNYIGFYFKNY